MARLGWLPGHPTTGAAAEGGDRESLSPGGLEGPLRPRRRAGSALTVWVTSGGSGPSQNFPPASCLPWSQTELTINLFPSEANGKETQTVPKDVDSERVCVLAQLTQPLEKFHLFWVPALFLTHLVLQRAQSLLHYPRPLHTVQVQQLCQDINPGETVQVGTPSAATPALIPTLLCPGHQRTEGTSFPRSSRTSVQCPGSSAPCSASPGTAGAAGSSPSGTSPRREGQPLHFSPVSPLPKEEDGSAVTSLGIPNSRNTACMPSLVPQGWCRALRRGQRQEGTGSH